MKLQKRERYLLIFLGNILLVAALYFLVILPQVNSFNTGKAELAELKIKYAAVESTINQLAAVDAEVKTLQVEASKLVKLMGLDESFDVSLLLSEMQIDYNMTPESLSISQPTLASPPVNTSEEAVPAVGEVPNVAFTRNVSLTTSGKEVDARQFLDALSGYNPSLLINSYQFSPSENSETSIYSMSITIYQFAEPDWSTDEISITY